MRWNTPVVVVSVAFACIAAASAAGGTVVSRWSFDGEQPGANAVEGGPAARVEGATAAEGHSGRALQFEDWSVRNYLKPDPRQASRVVVPDGPALSPTGPFKVSAWIYPTADPIFYGGIVEKGAGLGASYRLVLLRGLKVEAAFGDRHVTARSAVPLTLDAWHEVALSFDGTTLALLVDGKEAARAPVPAGSKLASKADLVIGERFTGRIDDVTIASE